MNTLFDFSLENGPYFKEKATFKFTKGITFVHGRNLHRVGKDASNGAGKSLLFSVLPNLLFNTNPVIQKSAKQAAGKLYEKNTVAAVRMVVDGKKVRIQREGTKLKLFVNGKDTSSRVARGELSEFIDINETDFFSWVYLDSRRPNGFQLGTSAERLAYLTNLYRLGDLDVLRKYVSREIGSIAADKQVLDEVQANLAGDIKNAKQIPANIEEKCKATADWIRKATKVNQQLAVAEARQSAYAEYKREEKKLAGMERGEEGAADKVRDSISKADRIKELMAEAKSLQRKRDKLEELADVDETRIDEIREAKRELKTTLKEVCQLDAPTKPEGERLKLKGIDSTGKADAAIEGLVKKGKELAQKRAKFLNEVGDSDECPLCRSVLTKATRKNILDMFDAEFKSIKKQASRLQRAADWLEYDVFYADYKNDQKLAQRKARLEKLVKGYSIEDAEEKLSLKAELAKAQVKHSTEKLKKALASVLLEIERLNMEVDKTRKYNEQKRLVEKLVTGAPKEFDAARKQALEEKLDKAVTTLPKMEAEKALRIDAIKRIGQNKRRAAELKQKVEDEDSYRALMQAYSNKGIKTVLIRKIAEKLEANLNRFAKHIYSENFEFKLEVTETQFHVWVIRRAGIRGKVTSDVRHLSGAESRLFNVLWVLALLPTIPAKRRFSTLILDEPELGMDAPALEVFTKKMLPALTEIVPSVIVITPRNDYMADNARVVTVVKEKGQSRLVEGDYK